MEINSHCEDDFSEQILADLISQGCSSQELLDKFKEQSMKVRPAVKKLIAKADSLAESDRGKETLNELFG